METETPKTPPIDVADLLRLIERAEAAHGEPSPLIREVKRSKDPATRLVQGELETCLHKLDSLDDLVIRTLYERDFLRRRIAKLEGSIKILEGADAS